MNITEIEQPAAQASVRGMPFPTWPYFAADEIESVTAVLRSGKVNYWTGEEGHLFEREFANYVGNRHAVCWPMARLRWNWRFGHWE